MSNIDYILELCFEISSQGKTPSIALIRNKAKQPLPIPEVVKALQHWKSNPKSQPNPNSTLSTSQTSIQPSLEQRVFELESQVAKMSQLLAELNASKTMKLK